MSAIGYAIYAITFILLVVGICQALWVSKLKDKIETLEKANKEVNEYAKMLEDTYTAKGDHIRSGIYKTLSNSVEREVLVRVVHEIENLLEETLS